MTFHYRWYDLIRVIPSSLRPARLLVAAVIGLATSYGWHLYQIATPDATGGMAHWIASGAVILGWWWIFCAGKLILMRSTALTLGRSDMHATRRAIPWGLRFGGALARMPIVLVATGVPLLIIGLLVWLVVLLLGLIGLIDTTGYATTLLIWLPLSPYALLWVLTLPLSFAAMAAMGGDSWEAMGRGFVLGLRKAPLYAALALPQHALVAGILILGWTGLQELGPWLIGILLAPLFAVWTATDVAVYLIVRNRLDGAPVHEVKVPIEQLNQRVSRQELSVVTKRSESPTS